MKMEEKDAAAEEKDTAAEEKDPKPLTDEEFEAFRKKKNVRKGSSKRLLISLQAFSDTEGFRFPRGVSKTVLARARQREKTCHIL